VTTASLQRSRLRVWFALMLAIFLLFGGRLVQVQGLQAGGYAERAINELTRTATLHAQRGTITDSQGTVLARSIDTVDVTVDQTMILDPTGTAKLLAPILNLSEEYVVERLSGTRRFAYVVKGITPATWNRVDQAIDHVNETRAKDARIFGFFPQRSFKRIYPAGELGAAVLGYVDASGKGAGGVEFAMNTLLAGRDGKYVYTSGGGPVIPNARDVLTPAMQGADIHLTLNRDIQWMAQKAIAKQVKTSRADWGSVLVMDPATGKVLALATAPSFDPSATKPSDLTAMKPFAVSDVYEPGSTGKVMTVAAALEEGKVEPTTVFTIPWKVERGGRAFHDHDRHPVQKLTTAGILAISSNTGAIKVGEQMSAETLRTYISKFGVGQKTNIGLAGESAGLLPPLSSWSRTTFPAVSFGQSYSVTAVQATSVFATIANGGVRVPPTLIEGYTDSSGNYVTRPQDKGVRVISEDTATAVRIMMESVVSSSGTALSASIPGYRVAGKTGTAQRSDPTCGCYRGYVSSFIGFVPADNPRLVINVTVNNPRGLYYGSLIAAPIFKEVATFALKALAIPPSGVKVEPFPLDAKELKAREKAAAAATPAPTR
jgi:cell division protein FtsI (penicillin-binding protein 3)